jgi:ribosomal 50S subunit-recycling heat shock protein
MRLDKYLKISRIIKRRTIAKEACESSRVSINGKVAKPSSEVNENDIIEVRFAKGSLKAKIVNISQHVTKSDAKLMYEIILDNSEEAQKE